MLVLLRFRNIAVPIREAERKAEADFLVFLEERMAGTADIRANGGRPYTLRQFSLKQNSLSTLDQSWSDGEYPA